MQFQRNDKKRSAQPASEGRPAKDLQPTKKHPQRHCPWLLLANPAHAGKRNRVLSLSRCTWDHPRMCGEKGVYAMLYTGLWGSPPRMRGKVHLHSSLQVHLGITPAYAGKSKNAQGPADSCEDHPRMCGEKLMPPLLGFGLTGSPPHVRGKDAGPVVQGAVQGITPAYAGKSTRPNKTLRGSQDHPRTCGEKDSLPSA